MACTVWLCVFVCVCCNMLYLTLPAAVSSLSYIMSSLAPSHCSIYTLLSKQSGQCLAAQRMLHDASTMCAVSHPPIRSLSPLLRQHFQLCLYPYIMSTSFLQEAESTKVEYKDHLLASSFTTSCYMKTLLKQSWERESIYPKYTLQY